MGSPARLAANRENATKSTGPRTPTGRATSAGNATRHGLHVAGVVPALGESPEEFERLRLAVRAQLRPRGELDGRLADRVALLLWRLDRVTRYEATAAQGAASIPNLPPDPDAITGIGIDLSFRVPPDAPPAQRLAFLRNRSGPWAEEAARLRRTADALGGGTERVADLSQVSFSVADVLAWPQGWGRDVWAVALQKHQVPAGRRLSGDELLGLLHALAKDAGRDPTEFVTAVRADMARRVAADEKIPVERRAEADRLAAGLKAARDRALMAAACGDDAVTDRVIRIEAHLTRQLEATLELFEKVRVRGGKKAGSVALGTVVRSLCSRVAELGVLGAGSQSVGLGSFRSGDAAEADAELPQSNVRE